MSTIDPWHTVTYFPAQQDAVHYLLNAPINGGLAKQPDGSWAEEPHTRSPWLWIWIDGTLVLGFFPQGVYGFSGTELARQADYADAERAGTVGEIKLPIDITCADCGTTRATKYVVSVGPVDRDATAVCIACVSFKDLQADPLDEKRRYYEEN